MAIISGVRYTINVEGNGYVTNTFVTTNYTPTSKIELKFDNITNSNGEINIPLVGMDLIKTIIADSTNATIKLYNNSGMINRYDISGAMICELAPVVSSGIINATLSTIDTVGITASISFIGYV